jgi:hypothetical protein
VIARADHDVRLAGQRFQVASSSDNLCARSQGMENVQQVSDNCHDIKLDRMPFHPFEPVQIVAESGNQQKAHRFFWGDFIKKERAAAG